MNIKRFSNKFICMILVVFSFIITLTACGKVEFNVNFVVDGAVYATVDTNGNEVIKMPENPTKEGYSFDGWYWDNGEWKTPFTANSLLDAPLSSDMSVYAKFVSNKVPPTEAFIVSGLKNIPNIVEVEVATEYNDPNGQLNKTGGYIADIFFSVDIINQNLISGTTLVEKGTDAGGSIEVYKSAKDAEARNTYLAAFDGGILASGSHKVIGTCVVRTSHELTASLQNILENNIEKLLTGSTEAYVSMDSYLYTVAKQVADKDNLSAYETATKLIELGYPLEKSEQIAKDCGVNFNEIAKNAVEGYAEYYAMVSPLMVAELLADHEFTAANISYAVQNATIDWEFYATRHAEEYVLITESEGEYLTPNSVLVYLCWEKGYIYDWDEYVFDKSEYCQIAIDNLEVNWNQKALEYISYIEADGPLAQKSSYISALTGMDFTQAQAEYAVANCTINWNERALYCIEHFVEDLSTTPPNYSQCAAKLTEWGFNTTEINYAVANYDGLIYPDKLDYVITLNPNGGTVSKTTVNVEFGKSYTLPTPTKTGYEFNGWYKGSTKVTNGTWYTAEDVTLVAEWKIAAYSITYSLGGGTNGSNPSTYTINSSFTLNNPTKTGYTFTGWTYSDQSTPVMNVTIPQGTTGNKTFTANWEANPYTVSFDANGGSVSINEKTIIYGSSYTLPTPTKTGYEFNGWYNGNSKVSSSTWNIANNVTLVAEWTAKSFTITYKPNGGSISSLTQSVSYNSDYTLRTPTRTGYTFKGWKNGNSDFTSGKWTLTSNVTLVAQWDANTYTITFNANNGTVTPTSATATYDSSVTLPTPTRGGYAFSGWYNGNTKYTTGKWETANNTTLTAKWEAIFTRSGSQITGFTNYGKANCTNVIIPTEIDSVAIKSIANSAFANCSNIESVIIENGITQIGIRAFAFCYSLKQVELGNTVTTLESQSFAFTIVEEFIFPESVTTIGPMVLHDCTELKSVHIPKNVLTIRTNPFEGCSGLQTITVDVDNKYYTSIGNCLIDIEAGTIISGCKNSVIPTDTSIHTIGADAFYGQEGLTSIVIPSNIKTIKSSFTYCENLKRIVYEGTMQQWDDIPKGTYWNLGMKNYIIECSDGTIR